MRKGDKGKKVFGVIVILAIIVSVFSGVVSAEDVSGGLKQSVADAEIQTAVGNLSSEELTKALDAVTDDTVNIEFADQSAELGVVSSRSSYDPQAAVNYAETWCHDYNSNNPYVCDPYQDYSSRGGDCANFVSQCLKAGGLDLSAGTVDSCGCIIRCTVLNDSLVNTLPVQKWEMWLRSRVMGTEREPEWFVPGDPAIFGKSFDHPTTHAVIAVSGDASNYATCDSHSPDIDHKSIRWFFTTYPDLDRVTFYHISTQPVQKPTVETRAASSIMTTAAFINGRILDDGGSTILERRFDWGTTPTCEDDWTADVTVVGNDFFYFLTGLNPGTTYYFRAWAKNSAGWSHGNVLLFTTTSPSIDLSPSSYGFGDRQVGQCSSEYSFTLTNTGGGTATGTVSRTGTHATQFTITQGSGGFSLGTGASKTIKVKFCPTSTGAKSATLFADGTNCNDDSSSLSGTGMQAPSIDLSPSSYGFGDRQVGQCSSEYSFTLTNTGGSTATGSVSLTGTHATQFTITQGSGSFSLGTGASKTIKVKFCPTSTGAKSATLFADGSNCNDDTSSLSGTGMQAPSIDLSPSSYGFGDRQVGQCSSEYSFTLTNTGGGTATGTVSRTGTHATQFTITQGSGGFSLGTGASKTIKVKFCPTSTGAKSATLFADGTNCNDDSSSLSGTGMQAPSIDLSPSSHSFGSVEVGQCSSEYSFTLTNTGGSTATGSVSLTGTHATQFTITQGSGSFSLGTGASKTIKVKFCPTSTGAKSATLFADGSNCNDDTSSLSGTGMQAPSIDLSPSSYGFGDRQVGQCSSEYSFTLTNTGGGTATGTVSRTGTHATQFTITQGSGGFSLGTGASKTIKVKFCPTSTGAKTATLFADGSNCNDDTSSLSGTGTQPPSIDLSPSSYGFGDMQVGQCSSEYSFTLTNTGGGTATGSVSKTGTDATQFTITQGSGGFSLGTGASKTIKVKFCPTSTGAKSATLFADGSNCNDDTSSLSGTGTHVPSIDLSPSSYGFGDMQVGQCSSEYSFTLTNTGGGTATGSVSRTGTHATQFTITQGSGSFSLGTGASKTIKVKFCPTSTGAKSATLFADGSNCNDDTSSLSGTGTQPPSIDLSPSSYGFGDMQVGQCSSEYSFTLTNTGGGTATGSVSRTGTHATQFTITQGSGGFSLGTGASKTIKVKFCPTSTGAKTATLFADGSNCNDDSSSLSGTGVESWSVRLDVTCGVGTDVVAEFGLNEAATDGFDDQFDVPLPPSPPPPYQLAYFYYPGNPVGVKSLITSYIPPDQEGNSWPFQVGYNGDASDVTITWNAEDIAAVPADTPLFFDTNGKQRIDMRTTPSYTFSATTGTYEFEITTEDPVCEYTFELCTGWNMISFPLEPLDKDPDTIFGPDYYCLYTWDPVSGSYVSVDEVETNRGYWLLVLEDRSVTVMGTPIYEYCTSLTHGWNMIGSIFDTTTAPDGTETVPADQMYQNLYAWSVDHYVLTQDIEPGVGYWALAYSDCELCVFPAPPPPPSSTLQALSLQALSLVSLRRSQVPRDSNDLLGPRRALNDWGVRLDVTGGVGTAVVAEFGLNEAATDGFDDQFDVPLPPSPPPPYQQAYFYYPGNPVGVKRLRTSYIPPHSPCNIWPFQLDYNGDASDVTITWNADDIAAVPVECSLLFVVDAVEIDMRTTPSYTFSATTGTYEFEIRACCDDGVKKPDLIITEKWLCWPDNCTICYNVTNTGDGTAPAGHNTTLYVDGVAVAYDHVPVDLAPGESYTGCFNGYVWIYTPPSDNITVCADNNESLDELDETNNCLTNIWMCGDVNGDGKVTMSDVRKVFNRYLDPNYPLDQPWAADVNCDGKVTMSDVRKVFNRYLDPGYDLNCCCEGVG